jgi:vitamin B12/bleomycin/antimicrobial peptide transport system ATP-binding/permease protein
LVFWREICHYVPMGTLRKAATYPEPAESKLLAEITHAFELVGLSHLVDSLEEEGPWDQTLSGGEKQRLAFARIILHRPDVVVLDEATSALDPPSQDGLMNLLTKELHATTIVSVGHRPELEAFHSRKVVLERREGGARFVRDTTLRLKPHPSRKPSEAMVRPPKGSSRSAARRVSASLARWAQRFLRH